MSHDHIDEGEYMEQDHKRGPGWFLKISYIVITAFCVYYALTYWDWQSSYDEQQAEIQHRIEGK